MAHDMWMEANPKTTKHGPSTHHCACRHGSAKTSFQSGCPCSAILPMRLSPIVVRQLLPLPPRLTPRQSSISNVRSKPGLQLRIFTAKIFSCDQQECQEQSSTPIFDSQDPCLTSFFLPLLDLTYSSCNFCRHQDGQPQNTEASRRLGPRMR